MAESAETHWPTELPPSTPTPKASVNPQMFPILFPLPMPGVPLQNSEHDHGAGLYAVPFYPFMGAMTGSSPSTLIPIKYRIPTRTSAAAEVSGEQIGQEARLQQQQGPQRQVVVRRFQFVIHLDLALILKLAAAIFLFNQEGSRKRLIVLIFFAMLVYLYQTGVLPLVVRWVRRGAPEPRPAVQPGNRAPIENNAQNDPRPEENHRADGPNENQNEHAENENVPAENENLPVPDRGNGIDRWGIVREIQTIIVGFVVSLVPGFHNND